MVKIEGNIPSVGPVKQPSRTYDEAAVSRLVAKGLKNADVAGTLSRALQSANS